MDDCIFCQVIAGKSLSYKIYEDDTFVGILDLFPKNRGHVLLMPKKHYLWVYDVPEFDKYWKTALKLTVAMQKALKPTFIHYLTYGFHVPHAHIHIVPHYISIEKEEFFPDSIKLSKKEMKEIAAAIKKHIQS